MRFVVVTAVVFLAASAPGFAAATSEQMAMRAHLMTIFTADECRKLLNDETILAEAKKVLLEALKKAEPASADDTYQKIVQFVDSPEQRAKPVSGFATREACEALRRELTRGAD